MRIPYVTEILTVHFSCPFPQYLENSIRRRRTRQNSSTRWGFSLCISDKNTLCKRSTITFGMPLPLYKCHIFSAALINLCSLKSHKLWLEFRLRQKRCNNQLAKNDQSIQFLINKSTSDFALDKKVEYRITNKQKKPLSVVKFHFPWSIHKSINVLPFAVFLQFHFLH